MSPGSAGGNGKIWSDPFEERFFFAGEATHVHEYSTAHGVYGSGVRAAEEAIAALTSAADMKPTVSGLSGSS